ncbi:unnamed protein product [Brassica rapa subsp. trilocularis]
MSHFILKDLQFSSIPQGSGIYLLGCSKVLRIGKGIFSTILFSSGRITTQKTKKRK